MPPSRTSLIFSELPPQPVVRRDDRDAVRRRGSARNRRPRGVSVDDRESPVMSSVVAAQRRSRQGDRARDDSRAATTTTTDRGIIILRRSRG